MKSHTLRALLGHQEHVDASEPLAIVYKAFQKNGQSFMGVVEKGICLGVCSRSKVAMVLGTQYGYALYARTPIRQHLDDHPLLLKDTMPLERVLQETISRRDTELFNDVVLIDEELRYLGIIPMTTLIRLQHTLLKANLDEVNRQRETIAKRTEEMEEELRMAGDVQAVLMPEEKVEFHYRDTVSEHRLLIQPRYLAAESIGGDFYHTVEISPQHIFVIQADVMGHGVRSALITAILRALVDGLIRENPEPARFMTALNKELISILHAGTQVILVTAIVCEYDLLYRRFTVCSAGHPRPWLRQSKMDTYHRMELNKQTRGPALGFLENHQYAQSSFPLEDGHLLLFCTDGLIEARNEIGQEFGDYLLGKTLAEMTQVALGNLLDELILRGQKFSSTHRLEDDVCLIGVDFHCQPINVGI